MTARCRGRRILTLLVATMLHASPPAGAQQSSGTSRTALVREVFALVGVHVVPMTSDTVLRDMTVLVRDGRIAAIERGTARLPRNVRRISGDGKFLIPGLTDMHTHQ